MHNRPEVPFLTGGLSRASLIFNGAAGIRLALEEVDPRLYGVRARESSPANKERF